MSQRRWAGALLAVLAGSLLAVPGLARAGGEKEDVDKLKQQVKKLQDEVKSLRSQLDALKNKQPGFPGFPPGGPGGFQPGFPGFPPGGPGGFRLPPQFIKGKIKKVEGDDKNKVTIELNDKAELKSGQMVMVMRKGPPPQMTQIKITDVSGKEATGMIQGKGTVEAGDEVFAPPGFPGAGGFPGPGGGGFPVPPGGGAFPPGKGGFPGFGKQVEGKVTKFDKEKGVVTLSVGADSGLKAGQTMMAFKKGAQGRPVGMIQITSVKDKEVVGELKKGGFPGAPQGQLEENEELRLMPAPQGFPGGPGVRPGIAPPPPPLQPPPAPK